MKFVSALICVLLVLLGAESAFAGPGKSVETRLVPESVVEVKPLPLLKKECVTVVRKTVSVEPSHLYSIQPMLFESCGCCGTTQTFMQGTTHYRPEQRNNGTVITTDCE